jgi:hypothetical protein
MMPNLMPCPMPTCGAPIDAVHLVPQGMGAFTYVIRCGCGLSFDTGAQSEAAAADRWNERPAPADGLFQDRVQPWMLECFGTMIASDTRERNHRFLEEALELVQSCGATAGEAHELVDYVYDRETGEPFQEVGGVMVTLAALCLANGLNLHQAAETELARIWTKVDRFAPSKRRSLHSDRCQAPTLIAQRLPVS